MSIDPLAWIDDELSLLDDRRLLRHRTARDGPQAAELLIDGRKILNFTSNDYLGLATDHRVIEAAKQCMQEEAWGSGASPLVTGYAASHRQLESELAEFEGTAAALLFSSGFAANVGAITTLVGRGDVIFSDERNHASIIDGCRLSGARVQIYPHRDADYLEKMIQQAAGFRRRLIVTDSLFSMDGDLARLVEVVNLAERYGAMLMVDEAHATGVFGEKGRGLAEHFGVEDRVQIRVGTLSKALGCAGGFVVGSQRLIDWLVNRARVYIFSTAQPAASAAAAQASLGIVRDEPQRRTRLLIKSGQVRRQLQQQGWNVGESESQIIPIIVGNPKETMELAGKLREKDLWVPGIRPPSVPEGRSLLRISLSYAHTDEMIESLLQTLAGMAK